jgi:LuxR family maltose regulon positive regulatory protein
VRSDPVLGVALVGAMLQSGRLDDIAERLRDAERALAKTEQMGKEAGSDRALAEVPCQIEMYHAAMAQIRGDMSAMKTHAQRAVERALGDDYLGRAAGASLLGIAFWTDGDLQGAETSWREGLKGLEKAGHVADVLGGTIALAEIVAAQGRLREVGNVYEQGLRLVARHEGYVPRGLADLYAGLGDLNRERGDLTAARQHLAKSEELGEIAGLGPQRYRWCVAMSGLCQAEGDLPRAFDLLAEAERVYVSDFFPNVRPVRAQVARLHIATGQLGDAARWRRESGVGVDDRLSYLREFEHLTLARLLLSEQQAKRTERAFAELVAFLDRLEEAAESGGRMGSLLDVLVLQARAQVLRGDVGSALGALEQALALAEPEGYVRLFVDAGAGISDLLKAAEKRSTEPAYVRELLAAFTPLAPTVRASGPSPVEPLSERELDVLRLLRSDLDGPAIAQALGVSLNTMRTHTKNIYEKLGVNSRRSAVRRAEELNLLHSRQSG